VIHRNGHYARALRRERKLTVRRMAFALGWAPTSYRAFESGMRVYSHRPWDEILDAVAFVLQVERSALFGNRRVSAFGGETRRRREARNG
jgi:transcriptional regulator with XRE-family HTH domain